MIRSITRKLLPLAAFGAGLTVVPPKTKMAETKLLDGEIVNDLDNIDVIKELSRNPSICEVRESFPKQHENNYVKTGLLGAPGKFGTRSSFFFDSEQKSLTGVLKLGNLTDENGKVSDGIIYTILDEALCQCGFPLLPHRRGVTAKLSISFENRALPDTLVQLKAKVVEAKGRKVTVDGYLETLPLEGENPQKIASGNCIVVEPTWFKYFSWFNII